MKLPYDIMLRLHRGEVTPAEAFAIAARPAPTGIRVPCVIGANAAGMPGFGAMAAWLAQCGITLDVSHEFRHYAERWKPARNWATWGVKWESPTYRRGRKRVLYVENALLGQGSGLYLDDRGYFADSSITADAADPTHAEVAAMQTHCRAISGGMPWWPGGDPTGPYLIALQDPRDSATRARQYPYRGADPNQTTVDLAAALLPAGIPVIVRRHPRDRGTPPAIPPEWTWDREPNPWRSMAGARAIVTANSTMATEALALGLPVACLAKGAYTGRGVLLECAENLRRLAELPEFRPDEWQAIRYLCSVMRHQLGRADTRERVATLPPLRRWVRAVTGREAPSLAVADAAAWLDAHGTAEQRAHVARWRSCRTCARGRLAATILDMARAAGWRAAA